MQRLRADGIVCARTIDASNDVLAAAGQLAPAKHGNEHGGVKPASVMAGQSAKMVPVLRGEISNTQSRPLNGHPPSFYYGQNVCCTFKSEINDNYYYYVHTEE